MALEQRAAILPSTILLRGITTVGLSATLKLLCFSACGAAAKTAPCFSCFEGTQIASVLTTTTSLRRPMRVDVYNPGRG